MKKGDEAFRIAWGGGKPPKKGVLTAIEQMAGRPSRIYLPEAPDENAPLVKIGASDPEDDSRYQVTGEIARGGVGIIYRGRDRDLGRDVALKVLRPEHAESDAIVERFIEEAQVGAQLQHPGIVPVYGMGLQADGRPYFSMKLIKGRTLAALLKERKDPGVERRKFLRIFEQICQTMAYAHSRGVIHRDLKPSNVMVGSYGEVLVVDWGFSKVLGRPEPKREGTETIVATVRSTEGSESVSGSVMGTPAYMPPEQALGQVETLDEHTDVFALGAILAHILTDQPPYTGKGHDALVQAAQARLDECYERLDACGADKTLVGLVRRCLSPVSEERPPNASVLADEIDRHIGTVERRAREAQLAAIEQTEALAREERRALWERRTKRTTLTIAAVVLLAAVALAFLYVQRGAEEDARLAKVLPAVDRALDEARERRAERDWAVALAAAERARSLAQDTSAAPRATELLTTIREEKRKHDEHTASVSREDAFLEQVREILDSDNAFNEPLQRAFEEFGLDMEHQNKKLHRPAVLLDQVDRWLGHQVANLVSGGVTPKTLLAFAEQLDPDSDRRLMRRAAVAGNRRELVRLVRDKDWDTTPAHRLISFGLYLEWCGAYLEAARLAKRARDRFPGDPWIQHFAQAAFFRAGRLPEAHRAALAGAATRDSSHFWVHVSQVALARSRLDDALRAVRLADRTAPYPDAQSLEATCLIALGQAERQIESWFAELQSDSDNAAVRRRLAITLMRVGRAPEASDVLKPLLDSGDPYDWNLYAIARSGSKDVEGALEAYVECMRGAPEASPVAANIASALAPDRSLEQAEKWLNEHLPDLDSNGMAAFYDRFATSLRGHVVRDTRCDEAVEAARRAVAARPDVGSYQSNLVLQRYKWSGHRCTRRRSMPASRNRLRRVLP